MQNVIQSDEQLISSIPGILNSKISHLSEQEINEITAYWKDKLDENSSNYDMNAQVKLEYILNIIQNCIGKFHKRNFQFLILYLKGELTSVELKGGLIEAQTMFFSFKGFPYEREFLPARELNNDVNKQRLWILNYCFSGRLDNRDDGLRSEKIKHIKNKILIGQLKGSRISEIDILTFKNACPPLTEFVDSHGIYRISDFHLEALKKILTTRQSISALESEIEIAKRENPSAYFSDILERAIYGAILMSSDKLPNDLFSSFFIKKHLNEEKFSEFVLYSLNKGRLEVFKEIDLIVALQHLVNSDQEGKQKDFYQKLISQKKLDGFLTKILSFKDPADTIAGEKTLDQAQAALLSFYKNNEDLREEFIKNEKFRIFIFKTLSNNENKASGSDELFQTLSIRHRAVYHQHLITVAQANLPQLHINQGSKTKQKAIECLTEVPEELQEFLQISENEKNSWQQSMPSVSDDDGVYKKTSLESKHIGSDKSQQLFAKYDARGDFVMGLVDDNEKLYSGLKITADGRIQIGRFNDQGELILDSRDQVKLFENENLSEQKIKVLTRANLQELERGISFDGDDKQKSENLLGKDEKQDSEELLDQTVNAFSGFFGGILKMKPDELKTKVTSFVENQLGIELSSSNIALFTLKKIDGKWICGRKTGVKLEGSVMHGKSQITRGKITTDIFGESYFEKIEPGTAQFFSASSRRLNDLTQYKISTLSLPANIAYLHQHPAPVSENGLGLEDQKEALPVPKEALPVPKEALPVPIYPDRQEFLPRSYSIESNRRRDQQPTLNDRRPEGLPPLQGMDNEVSPLLSPSPSQGMDNEASTLLSPSPSPHAFNVHDSRSRCFGCFPLGSLFRSVVRRLGRSQ